MIARQYLRRLGALALIVAATALLGLFVAPSGTSSGGSTGTPTAAEAAPSSGRLLDRAALASRIEPPNELGEPLNDKGLWSILDRTGTRAGYIFETEPFAPLPGFAGEPINVLVTLDLNGRFLHAELIRHNEPVFVSGLGQAPFHEFMRQYRGHSIFDTITVGAPYGSGTQAPGQVYLDGVTKATASVRIAHESILAASLAIAREHMKGVSKLPPAYPKPDYEERLDWKALVEQGLAHRRIITNAEVQKAFAGSLWEDDDAEAADEPDAPYLDLYIIDLGPGSIARAVLDGDTLHQLQALLSVYDQDEPILLLANGRHTLVSEDFVRNTAPDLLALAQDGLPIALRDADIDVGLKPDVPDFEHMMIVRTDRRQGFDPTRDWDLIIRAVREHGMFRPEIGVRELTATQATAMRFFERPETQEPRPVWLESIYARSTDLAGLSLGLGALVLTMGLGMRGLAALTQFAALRIGFLAGMIVFVGWWGQGQLSIVTVIGTIRAALEGQSFAFLLYDPFSLLIWAVAFLALLIWGRGFFCGWLCPYGAMQELAHKAGRSLGLPSWELPPRWDRPLRFVKYAVLALLIGTGVVAPALNDALVEVEPFKTAVTVGFDREWPYVLYAAGWLALGLVMFKAFCRYLCPLGAFFAIGGLLRAKDWVPRRAACGSPCQLCKVRCGYGAIEKSGRVRYDECFQCLDCVTIHDDAKTCVPLVLAEKRAEKRGAREPVNDAPDLLPVRREARS